MLKGVEKLKNGRKKDSHVIPEHYIYIYIYYRGFLIENCVKNVNTVESQYSEPISALPWYSTEVVHYLEF